MARKNVENDAGVRRREPKTNCWSFNLYLSEIDGHWQNCGYAEYQRAFRVFKEYARVKCDLPHAFILHDRDKLENGEDDKPHVHYVIKLNHNVSLSWAINYINHTFGSVCTECKYAEPCYNLRHYVDDYMIHNGYPDKYQYMAADRTISGDLFETSYMDFMSIVMSCESFTQAQEVCATDEKLCKLFIKHCYFVKTQFMERANDGRNNNNDCGLHARIS